MCFAKTCAWLVALLLLAACGDNLFPSGEDKRPQVELGTTGSSVGQKGPEFTALDSAGNAVTLSSALAAKKGVVLYFTMWCPICDSHMSHMLETTIPSFPDVGFFAVDYVSGSVADAANSAASNGFAGTGFSILADFDHTVQQGYQGTMGTTVVIDKTGTVRMNEDYRDGSRLQAVLAGLP
jgi:peroxiredoxin